jgi:DNA-binding transcriptional LysR family regulator
MHAYVKKKGMDIMINFENIQYTKYFIRIVELGNMTAVAQELFISQSYLSRIVHELEDTLHVELFVHTKKKVILTSAGEAFYRYCKGLRAAYDEFFEKATALQGTVLGSLRVGYPKSGEQHIYGVSKIFTGRFPEVKIHYIRQGYYNQLAMLENDELDIIFMHSLELQNAKKRIQSLEIAKLPQMVLMNVENPLAKRSTVVFPELRDQKFILPSRDVQPAKVDLFFRTCSETGFVPKIYSYHYLYADYRMDIAVHKDIVSIVPTMWENPSKERYLKYVPLLGFPPDDISVAWDSHSKNGMIQQYIHAVKTYQETLPV